MSHPEPVGFKGLSGWVRDRLLGAMMFPAKDLIDATPSRGRFMPTPLRIQADLETETESIRPKIHIPRVERQQRDVEIPRPGSFRTIRVDNPETLQVEFRVIFGSGTAERIVRSYEETITQQQFYGASPTQHLYEQYKNPHQAWCDRHGYTDAFWQEGYWWAFPPNGVMPVRINDVRIAMHDVESSEP